MLLRDQKVQIEKSIIILHVTKVCCNGSTPLKLLVTNWLKTSNTMLISVRMFPMNSFSLEQRLATKKSTAGGTESNF